MASGALRGGTATDANVLEAIRRAPGTTRARLALELDVTAATVTYSVKRLLADGLIEETGRAKSTGGKPASLLQVRTSARWALGCTIELDRIAFVAMSMGGTLRARVVVPWQGDSADADLRRVLESGVSRLQEATDGARGTFVGTGITDLRASVPGFSAATVHDAAGHLEDLLEAPSHAGPPALCAALGSAWVGEQSGPRPCVTVHVGPTIEIALLADGSPLLPVASGGPGLDHVMVDPGGERCEVCGGRGCLRLTSSAAADLRRASEAGLAESLDLRLDENRQLAEHSRLTEAAALGDERAARIIRDSARCIGEALASVLGPLGIREVMLTGASVVMAPQLYASAVADALGARRSVLGDVHVGVSSVQPHPCAVGAAALALTSVRAPVV